MTDAMQFIERALKEDGQVELCFRVPPLLYAALELYKIDNTYPNSCRELYGYLVLEDFYKAYKKIFEAVEDGVKPYQGLIQPDYIQSFGVSSERYKKVSQGGKRSASIRVPKVFKEVCEFINICLGWHQSQEIIFRSLTEKILIVKLETQLDYLLKSNQQHKLLSEGYLNT